MSQAELDALKRAVEAHQTFIKRLPRLSGQQEALQDMLNELDTQRK